MIAIWIPACLQSDGLCLGPASQYSPFCFKMPCVGVLIFALHPAATAVDLHILCAATNLPTLPRGWGGLGWQEEEGHQWKNSACSQLDSPEVIHDEGGDITWWHTGSKPKFLPAGRCFLMDKIWPGSHIPLGIRVKYNTFAVKKTLWWQGWTGCAAVSCALPEEYLHITAGSRGVQ